VPRSTSIARSISIAYAMLKLTTRSGCAAAGASGGSASRWNS
jgi:hypothetical protein